MLKVYLLNEENNQGNPLHLCSLAIALHACPVLGLSLDHKDFTVIRRSRSLFTGTSSSTLLAMLVLEDAWIMARATLCQNIFTIGGVQVCFAAWADNCLFVARSLGNLDELAGALADALATKDLELKPTSFEAVASGNHIEDRHS